MATFRLIWAMLVLVWACPAVGATLRRVALLVAHPTGGPGTEPLRFAEQDALKMLAVLKDLGGFRESDTALLLAPTPDEVLDALQSTEARVRAAADAGERVLLLFYYSGHAASGELRLGTQGLNMGAVRRFLQISRAEMRIAFVDACQSGAITRLKGGRPGPSFVVDVEPARNSRGYVIVTSSSEHEASQESDDLHGSFFTHYLVSGLRGAADRSGDALITLSEAYAHAYNRTVSHTADTRGGTQHPTYSYDLQGNGAIVLTRLAGLGALLFSEGSVGDYLIYDLGRNVVVGEVDNRPGERRRLHVPQGRYAIKKRTREHLLLQAVDIGPRQQVMVQESAFERVAFEDDLTKGMAERVAWRESAPRVAVSARIGYQSFFDRPTRETLFHPSPLVGVRLQGTNWIGERWSVHADAALGQARSTLELGPYREQLPLTFTLMVAGAGLTYDWWLGRARIQVGPRISALYARRDFEADAIAYQDLFTFSPGLGLGVTWRTGRLQLGVETRAHYLRYTTAADDLADDRSLGFAEGYLSVGYTP